MARMNKRDLGNVVQQPEGDFQEGLGEEVAKALAYEIEVANEQIDDGAGSPEAGDR